MAPTLNAPSVAGELAVARGAAAVAAGRVPAVLAGGVDEVAPLVERALDELGASAQVRGEGVTLLLLETAESAAARGVTPLGEIAKLAFRMNIFPLIVTCSATGTGSPLNSKRRASKGCASSVPARTKSRYPGGAYIPRDSAWTSGVVSGPSSVPIRTPCCSGCDESA
jgi:hypothetical protein